MNDMTNPSALAAASDEELIDVLLNSLYPGASRASAKLVLEYCRAASLDPLQKPVHIVPMRVKTGQKNRNGYDEYTMRDTIMPGIGLYRVTAHRTGQYAGMDEPVIGPMRVHKYHKRVWVEQPNSDKKKPVDVEAEVVYPEWVMVTVWRLVGGFRSPFPAKEYWRENYAVAGPDTDAPNAMWAKRPIAQLVKCAEAQALRKGFSEVGAAPTAEELLDRDFDPEYLQMLEPVEKDKPKTPKRASESTGNVATTPAPPPALPDSTAEQAAAQALVQPQVNAAPAAEPVAPPPAEPPAPAPAEQKAPPPPPPPAEPAVEVELATNGEKMNILMKCKGKGFDVQTLLAEHNMALPLDLKGMSKDQFRKLKAVLG